MTTRDVFLCHSSEDKVSVVRPLHAALTAAGISCWLDEAEVHWGDSIVEKINEGLRDSQFVVVVLSETFLAKPWPRRELSSALSIESSTGGVRVLPLLVGSPEGRQAIFDQLPLLRDKLHMTWEGGPARLTAALRRRLGGATSRMSSGTSVEPAPSRQSYCQRCGHLAGTRSECTGGWSHHAFEAGTGREFCTRCGAKPGRRSECTGGWSHHAFKAGIGGEFCRRCGAQPGEPSECTGGWSHHAFEAGK